MLKIDFQKEKLIDVIQSKGVTLNKRNRKNLAHYYRENYTRVVANIIDDELVGHEYENLCFIEKVTPKVKRLSNR